MTTLKTRKVFAAAACSLALLGVAACGTEDTTAAAPSKESSSAAPSEASMDATSDLVGPGCADYAKAVPDGAGSVDGMAQDKVATAASNNPLLKTLVAAASGQLNKDVNLVDALNGGEFTVFAPVDDAFAKIDPATIDSLKTPEGADTLTKILTYHVVPGQISPDAIAGEQTTVEGDTVTITGSGDSLKVNDANVICGGVHTANATVYLIDSVLMPPM